MNLVKRIEALERQLQDPLEAELEALLREVMTFQDAEEILERCLRETAVQFDLTEDR